MEDPVDNLFAEAFTFHGGSYIVFPGIVERSTFILRHLAKTIFLNSESFSDHRFITAARGLLTGVLVLSNEIAQRAGIERGIEPISTSGRKVIIPSSQQLKRLKQAVSFSESELSSLLFRHNVNFFEIEQLIVRLGDISVTDYQIENGELLISPIVQAGNKFIVAIPGVLLSATWNRLIQLALECGMKDELVKHYGNSVWRTVFDSLSYIEHQAVPVALPTSPDLPQFRDAFFSFDSDKLAYVASITDSLDNYDIHDPFGRWLIDDIETKLGNHVQQVYEYVFTRLTGVNEILILIVLQGFGRSQMFGFSNLPEIQPLLLLGLSAGDLETITLLEGGEPLVLWKYAWASWRLEQNTRVLSHGELDKFYFYRDRGYCYYLSDEERPNFLTIGVGGAGDLRREVLHQRDWHAAPSYNPGYITEVTSLYSTRDIPIYIPRSVLNRIQQPIAVLVERLPLPVWIIGFDQKVEDREVRSLYVEFAETISYWVWQFSPSLESIFESFVPIYTSLIVRLHITSDQAWSQIQESQDFVDQTLITTEIDLEQGILDVTVSPKISFLLQRVDNEGERHLMYYVLRGFRALLPDIEREKLSNNIITSILEKFAPLGFKEKLFS